MDCLRRMDPNEHGNAWTCPVCDGMVIAYTAREGLQYAKDTMKAEMIKYIRLYHPIKKKCRKYKVD